MRELEIIKETAKMLSEVEPLMKFYGFKRVKRYDVHIYKKGDLRVEVAKIDGVLHYSC